MTRTHVVTLTTGLLLLAGAGAFWWEGHRAAPTQQQPAATPGEQAADYLLERTKGDSAAPITVYEASDFQCPFCRRFWEETLPHLEREYIAAGKLRLIFVNFPIPSLHPNATAAHEFAMCAARQNRFWAAHDVLFRYQEHWARLQDPSAFFRSLGDSVGADRARLERCFATGEMRQLILSEAAAAYRAGIQSTPSFVIEGALLPGHAPIEAWRPILDSIYVAKTGGR